MTKKKDFPKVYVATFPNGKQYVGITTYILAYRRTAHYSRAKKGSKFAIHNAIRKYGQDVKWEVLKICFSYEEAKESEIEFIKDLNTLAPNGYNLTTGGDGTAGHTLSLEQRQRLSDAHKGYIMPDSQKLAISFANKGRIKTDKQRENMSVAQKGKTLSPNHLDTLRKIKCVPIKVFKKQDGAFIGIWPSITQCSKDLNIHKNAITNCLSGLSKSVGGYLVIRSK